VLGPPEAAPAPAAAPPGAPATPAAASSGKFRPLTPEERQQLAEERAAIENQRRARGLQVDESDEPIVHGDPRARWTLALSIDSLFYTDSGYDLFDDDNVGSRLGLWAGFDFLRLSPQAALAVELGVGAESEKTAIWQGVINSKLESLTASAGLSLRYALFPWLDPQLRAAGGVTRFTFQFDTSDAETYDDDAVSAFGALSAGVMFHTPAGVFENRRGSFASFGFGLLVEGGYALRQSIDLAPSRGAASHAIPITQAGLGELALSGPYVRTSLLVRF
jgi:hypothetical protein